MGKRASHGGPQGFDSRKRQKIVHEAPTFEAIQTSRHLRQLLAVERDLTKARHGLQSFKVLLDTLTVPEQPQNAEQWTILRQYLESSTPRDHEDADAVFLPEVMEIWEAAAKAGNDDVLSAVTVVLALLLKLLSQVLDLRTQGLGICRTLLQKRQLELLAKNLSADKAKAFIISPTLRLVREAVCFDGGLLAKAFFRERKYTYHSLSRNMRLKYLGEGVEDYKRTSARTCAIRLLMSTLKFLHWEAKRELLYERDLAAALTSSIKDDPPYLVHEILDGLKADVILDKKLPSETKGRLLNANTLSRFGLLYSYAHSTQANPEARPVDEAVHDFLMTVCTSQTAGVLRPDSGLYPKGIDPASDHLQELASGSDLSLDRIVWMEKFKDEIPVHNYVLADFLKSLRPWVSTKQSELLISVLAAAPELVANYYQTKKDFSFDPKLSATWIGYAALLFSTVQLPFLPFFGNELDFAPVPPPISIILDNILPIPLTQKALSRCLSHESKLVSFFAIRILVIALQKLETALEMIRQAALTAGPLWSDASRRLIDEFTQRCPSLKFVTTAYRGIPEEDFLSREAASRLLRLYYHVIPQVALAAKFDVSPLLVTLIKRLDNPSDSAQHHVLSLMELENLLMIAKSSPGMRWFVKAEQLTLSPFTALLKVYANAPEGVSLQTLEEILAFVADEHEIFLSAGEGLQLRHLLAALTRLNDQISLQSCGGIWSFLDNCLHRCSTKVMRYLELSQELAPNTRTGPLTATIHEQLPFVVSGDPSALKDVGKFVGAYTTVAKLAKEHKSLLGAIQKMVGTNFDEELLGDASLKKSLKPSKSNRKTRGVVTDPTDECSEPEDDENFQEELLALAAGIDIPEPDNSALLKWTSRSASDIVEEGFASSLIRLLASPHTSIRKEALTNILKMAEKIKESSYEEKEQVWLLLVELAESSKAGVDEGPIPGHLVAFACRALDVLKNPLHCLYDKVNTFLTRGPEWTLDRIPLLHDVLEEAPSRDDSYYAGVAWLLGYLLESLRTTEDLALFHKRRVYERIFSLASNEYMRLPLRTLLMKIVYRTSCLEGGSTTLITRFGAISWLEAQRSQRSSQAELDFLKALQQRLRDTCDQSRIDEWSRGGVGLLIGEVGA